MPAGQFRTFLDRRLLEKGYSDISRISTDKNLLPPSVIAFARYNASKDSFEEFEIKFSDSRHIGEFAYHLSDRLTGYRLVSGPRLADWKPQPTRADRT